MNTARAGFFTATLIAAGAAWAGGHESAATAGDATAGKDKAASCMGCHQADDFAGMEPAAITDAVRAVADGGVAHPGVGELSDQDIADVSAYFQAAGG